MEYTRFSGLHQLFEFKHLKIWLPIPVPFPFPANEAITIGVCIKEDEKMTGITPAVFTFNGICVDCPP